MDIQRLHPSISGAQTRDAASARLNRISANSQGAGRSRPANAGRGLSKISAPQVTSDPALQSVLSSEETQALTQLFSAFRTAAESGPTGTYTGRGTAPRLPPLGGGRPGQLIDVVG
jgi:hypothetical protein